MWVIGLQGMIYKPLFSPFEIQSRLERLAQESDGLGSECALYSRRSWIGACNPRSCCEFCITRFKVPTQAQQEEAAPAQRHWAGPPCIERAEGTPVACRRQFTVIPVGGAKKPVSASFQEPLPALSLTPYAVPVPWAERDKR